MPAARSLSGGRTGPGKFANYGGRSGVRGSTSPTSNGVRYPTTPPPLQRADIIDLGERQRAATRGLQESMARRSRDRGKLKIGFNDFKRRLGRDMVRDESGIRGDMAARGLAYSPAGLGKGLRDLRDTTADTLAAEQRTLAGQLAELDDMVNQSRINRDLETERIGADRARRVTELDRLIRAVGI